MSLRAIIEIAVSLENFINVDLIQQGIYQLRLTLYHLSSDGTKKYIALPYIVSPTAFHRDYDRVHFNGMLPYRIDEISHQFYSKSFIIRYNEETVDLGHLIEFRSELDIVPGYEQTPFFLEVELMIIELSSIGGAKYAASVFRANEENTKLFKSISTRCFKLNNIVENVSCGCIPVIFDELHFSCSNIMFHSVTFDYRFRKFSLDSINSLLNENYAEPVVKVVQVGSLQNKAAKSRNNASTITGYLFGDSLGKVNRRLRASEIDEVYKKYVSFLVGIQEKLILQYNTYGQRILNKKEIKKLEIINKKNNNTGNILKIEESTDEDNLAEVVEIKKLETKFSERMKSRQPYEISEEIMQEINEIAGTTMQLWNKHLELVRCSAKTIMKFLSEDYKRTIKESFSYFIFSNEIKYSQTVNYAELHKIQSQSLRACKFFDTLKVLPIQDQGVFGITENIPLIFEDSSVKLATKEEEKNPPQLFESGKHLFVFVHGFQANSFDMRTIKNYVALLCPKAHFLCSTQNEKKTDGDIGIMGERLATEVRKYIMKWFPRTGWLSKISFIGHSLGGVIIRAALPHLSEYKEKMYTFISFSSPHLGYLYSNNTLINAGMWVLQKWFKSVCLEQLSMTDSTSLNKCFMYNLAKSPGLDWFKNVVLVNSFQDAYSPYESARMEISSKAFEDPKNGSLYIQMVDSMREKLKKTNLYKIDIGFNINEANVSNFIGRTAHIMFLQNEILMKVFIYRYSNFFNQQFIQ